MNKKLGLIYQIIPDRFMIGNTKTIEKKFSERVYNDSAIPKKWSDLPDQSQPLSYQHFGGDLDGICEKLDYIQELGIDAVYITPVHRAETYHRYDAYDYRSVAVELGGEAAFDRLLKEIHSRKMKLIVDLVLNHVSHKHPFFLEALNGNPYYRDFFKFREDGSYESWWGYPRLPELNLENPKVLEEFISGEKSVLNFWIDKGVDAFRLDCANDLGVAVCGLVRETARKRNPEILLFGEVFHYAADWLKALDGTQSYYGTSAIYSLLNGEIGSAHFCDAMETLYTASAQNSDCNLSWNMLSSHDYPRVLTNLHHDMRKVEMALILQFTLPGIPMIYYGDEIGMDGGNDPMNRAPMIWDKDKWNNEVSSLYQRMVQLRKTHPEFTSGVFKNLSRHGMDGIVAFAREDTVDPRNYSLIFINTTNAFRRFRIFVPISHMFSDMELVDIFSGQRTKSLAGSLYIDLPAMSAAVYCPDYFCKAGYRFSKRL